MLRISVIIPTLNEATTIARCLNSVAAQNPDELIVCDASSPDGTAQIAQRAGARVLQSPPGRGIQQDLGARSATGEVLLFLHADCYLEAGGIDVLRSFAGRNPNVPGGCFRLTVESAAPSFRLINASAHLRASLLGYPYGDQGIFVRTDRFWEVGGFGPLPLMEDFFLGPKLRQFGRIALLPKRIFVSPRRWHRRGILGQSIRNWSFALAALGGVCPSRLARRYPHVR